MKNLGKCAPGGESISAGFFLILATCLPQNQYQHLRYDIFRIINPFSHVLRLKILLMICFGCNPCKTIAKHLYPFFALCLFGYIFKHRT